METNIKPIVAPIKEADRTVFFIDGNRKTPDFTRKDGVFQL